MASTKAVANVQTVVLLDCTAEKLAKSAKKE